jgi:precorrin-6B C5,15-methyltransferase / cobalt-precorrin-6B C5,C15-methyltransferase
MIESPWLTILGLGEDGPDGLSPASRAALDAAEVVMGPARHLALIGDLAAETVTWPVPFADGLPLLLAHRGCRVVVLASGDPFWFGAGTVLARELDPAEWQALPGPSTFSLATARMGWALETTVCAGLHAAPFARVRPNLTPGARVIALLRDATAVNEFAGWLDGLGFGDTLLTVMQALGGPRECVRTAFAKSYALEAVAHPVCVAFQVAGDGAALPRASGLPDDFFAHDGQITKRPLRALTLSALAPRAGEHLWDIGSGSGSVAIEWLLTHPATTATAIEVRADRAARVVANAAQLGVDRLQVITGSAPAALAGLTRPDAIFVGGGLSADLLATLGDIAPGARLVANAVTLESEALMIDAQARLGGNLLQIALSQTAPLGRFRGWHPARPIVQWSVTL